MNADTDGFLEGILRSEPGSPQWILYAAAALQFPAYQGQSLGEPSDGVEPDWGHDEPREDIVRWLPGKRREPSVTTVRTCWHHRGPCSTKNLLRACLERPWTIARTSPVQMLNPRPPNLQKPSEETLTD